MRGEEAPATVPSSREREIPPRARRRVSLASLLSAALGNTSACAEKSCGTRRWGRSHWKYLRVRGEENGVCPQQGAAAEIPPRARRRAAQMIWDTQVLRNTSACAEKRKQLTSRGYLSWKYLRVRGEELWLRGGCRRWWEIPPRARRRGRGN